MTTIKVETAGENCKHIFRQVQQSQENKNRPYLLAGFACSNCGKKRKFATFMNGFWTERRILKGEEYV
ncbi:MAG: hypothetical protein K8T10_16170 [Candidatus Eremiobacteraeota bacterium]|nr:hypothetical protein [Candidatus Eremiobacteraeota bacterium]